MEMKRSNGVAAVLKKLPEKHCCVFRYGSRVYGTADDQSDHDLQIVLDNISYHVEDWRNACKTWDTDLHVWHQYEFQAALDDHRVYALECFFLPQEHKLRNDLNLTFKLNKSKLRDEFSRVASNSWVKAKKKLIVEADYNERIAKKSIFHSFRILDFGVQIATEGRIVNYNSMNELYHEIMELPADWPTIDTALRERHNALASKFREVCPKAIK